MSPKILPPELSTNIGKFLDTKDAIFVHDLLDRKKRYNEGFYKMLCIRDYKIAIKPKYLTWNQYYENLSSTFYEELRFGHHCIFRDEPTIQYIMEIFLFYLALMIFVFLLNYLELYWISIIFMLHILYFDMYILSTVLTPIIDILTPLTQIFHFHILWILYITKNIYPNISLLILPICATYFFLTRRSMINKKRVLRAVVDTILLWVESIIASKLVITTFHEYTSSPYIIISGILIPSLIRDRDLKKFIIVENYTYNGLCEHCNYLYGILKDEHQHFQIECKLTYLEFLHHYIDRVIICLLSLRR
jgi:hypothetical protein